MASDKDHKGPPSYGAAQRTQASKAEEERHPAQPPPAKPGVPEPDQQPKPETEAKEPEEKTVAKEEAMQLFRAGHKLKKKGDPSEKWFAAVRLHGQLCLAQPLDEELEKKVVDEELVLVAD